MLVVLHNTRINEVVQYLKPFSYWITFITSPIPRSKKERSGLQIIVDDMTDIDRRYFNDVWPDAELFYIDNKTKIILWLL